MQNEKCEIQEGYAIAPSWCRAINLLRLGKCFFMQVWCQESGAFPSPPPRSFLRVRRLYLFVAWAVLKVKTIPVNVNINFVCSNILQVLKKPTCTCKDDGTRSRDAMASRCAAFIRRGTDGAASHLRVVGSCCICAFAAHCLKIVSYFTPHSAHRVAKPAHLVLQLTFLCWRATPRLPRYLVRCTARPSLWRC